jgi:drug/metabolite transporter (DMT)-like permease
MLLMAGSSALFPAGDVISKYLQTMYPLIEVVWARYLVHFLIMFVVLGGFRTLPRFRTASLKLQLGRVVISTVATMAFIASLQFIPLVVAISLLFANPLFTVALSVPLLRERVGVHRWSAVAVGFIGVLIVFRPDEGLLQWGALLALFSGLSVSTLHITARILGRTDHPVTTVLYMAAGGTALLSLAVPFHWVTPDWPSIGLMLVSGVFAALGHIGVLTAIRQAPVSALAPFSYAQIVTATALGYVVFGEVPEIVGLAGLTVIVASGFYILHRERRVGAKAA